MNSDSSSSEAVSSFVQALPATEAQAKVSPPNFKETFSKQVVAKLPYSVNHVGMSLRSVPFVHHDTPR